jgi:hypothetical protein
MAPRQRFDRPGQRLAPTPIEVGSQPALGGAAAVSTAWMDSDDGAALEERRRALRAMWRSRDRLSSMPFQKIRTLIPEPSAGEREQRGLERAAFENRKSRVASSRTWTSATSGQPAAASPEIPRHNPLEPALLDRRRRGRR